ncbi:caspase family protein [Parvicella tangerina]|uniref:Peptidase C14 caspase domain-containing protein n=1 Tax=Parvicella tangerina TaxID=2829795 RepID=A0A916JMU0_9FLAO|nr:caspase family protein [Parvicella tangerina]CAG5082467.1 hypothetical protein CRYO30217_01926 [Parvicella tangerina]
MVKAYFLILACIVFGELSIAQDLAPEVVVQTGHSANVLDLALTTDGNYLISCSKDGRILVWDRTTQKQFKEFRVHSDVVTSIILHPQDPAVFYSSSMDGKVYSHNLFSSESELMTNVGSPVSKLIYLPDSKRFVVGCEGVVLYDANFNVLKSFGIFSEIGIFDDSGSMVTDVDVSDDETWCSVTNGAGKAVAFKLEGGEQMYAQQKPSIEKVLLVHNGKKVLQCFSGGAIRISDVQGIGTRLILGRDQSVKSAVDKHEKLAYIGTGNGNLLVLNTKSVFIKKTVKISDFKITSVKVNELSNEVLVADEAGKIFILDLKNLSVKEVYEAKIKRVTAISASANGKMIAVAFQNNELNVFNLSNLQTISNTALVNKNSSERYQTEVVEVSWDGDRVKVTFLKKKTSIEIRDRYDYVKEYEAYWDLSSEKLDDIKRVGIPQFSVQYDRGLLSNGITQRSRLAYLYPNKITTYDGEAKLSGSNSQFISTTGGNVSITHNDVITAIAECDHYLASASWDGSVCLWDKSTKGLLNRIYLFDRNQFALFDNEDYYYSSKNGIKNIGFRMDNAMYSFEQFDLLYNRPDRVFRGLESVLGNEVIEDYALAYQKRLQRLGLKEDNLVLNATEIPVLSMEGELEENRYKLSLDWELKKETQSRLHIYINGVPVYGVQGLEITQNKNTSTTLLELEEGKNNVVAYISTDKGMKSLRSEVIVNVEWQANNPTDLYLVTIGCSKYLEDQYDLDYASKDAADVANFMSKSDRFEKANILTILDEEVMKSSLSVIKNHIANADINDVVMVYVAGHGVLSKNYDLYLATHDMDFLHPEENGIAYNQLETIIASSKSRHKCLFLDACHSGEIDKTEVELAQVESTTEDGDIKFRSFNGGTNIAEQNSFQLSKNLFADMIPNHGVTIVSSAGGSEFALEGDSWKNGVFTYSFLSGLSNKAADFNADGKVMLSEITKYVLNNVVKLTNGAQNPTSRIENIYNDIEIY